MTRKQWILLAVVAVVVLAVIAFAFHRHTFWWGVLVGATPLLIAANFVGGSVVQGFRDGTLFR